MEVLGASPNSTYFIYTPFLSQWEPKVAYNILTFFTLPVG